MLSLAQTCAPQVAPGTLLSVAWGESHWNPAAQHMNRNGTIDSGISQINEVNWSRMGLTRASATDPCLSLRASARILLENYHPADATSAEQQRALTVAVAAYNPGDPNYVRSIEAAARHVIPEIRAAGIPAAETSTAPDSGAAPASLELGEPPRWDKWAHREWLENKERNK
jgi:type IV secretion system protein VirB1